MRHRGLKRTKERFHFHLVVLILAGFISGCAPSRTVRVAPPGHGNATVCCDSPAEDLKSVGLQSRSGETLGNSKEQYTVTKWLQPSERGTRPFTDFFFRTQQGNKVKLQDLQGVPIALSFLYTRCENPNKCPLVARTMASLQHALDEAALSGKVQLLLITYDPDYDSPAVLAGFGSSHGLRFDGNVLMLQPDSKQKDRFFKELNVGVNYDGTRVNIHSIQLMLFDQQWRYVRTYHSLIWDNAKVLKDLKTLLDETKL